MRRTARDTARGPIAAIALAMLVLAASGCGNPTDSTSSPEEPKSGDAELSALTVSEGTLKPEFDPDITSYIVYVANATTAVTVTGAASDGNATLSANNGVAQSLSVGENVVTIAVTAQDGTTQDYTVAVRRLFALIMRDVPSGSFQLDGNPANVSSVGAFRMGATEITRAQFRLIMGVDPSVSGVSTGSDDPAQGVSWYEAIAFCNKLSLAENRYPVYEVEGVDFAALEYADIPTGYSPAWNAATAEWAAPGYRLPTEMEWMRAALGTLSGGMDTTGYGKPFSGSNGFNSVDSFAWHSGNSGGTTHPVGTRATNDLFISDLSGNVREWIWDGYAAYPIGSTTDYRGPYASGSRVCRGGSWAAPAGNCAVAFRESVLPDARSSDLGFRVVRAW